MRRILVVFLVLSLAGCAFNGGGKRSGKSYVIKGKRYYILSSAEGFKEKGIASWYGEPFHGRKTASGEVYDMNLISAAHKTLPLHTWVEVRNLDNDRTLNVRVNDRGPFVSGRVIDLSKGAAKALGVFQPGVARVAIAAITGARARDLTLAERSGAGRPVAGAQPARRLAADQPPQKKSSAYRVVVADTTDPDRAKRLMGSLGQEFSPVKLGAVHRDGQTSFSVYLDGVASQKEAQELKSRLSQRGYAEARVVGR